MPTNLLLVGLERLATVLNPLRALASGDPRALDRFSRETGWIFVESAADSFRAVSGLVEAADTTAALARSLGADTENPPPLTEISEAIAAVLEAIQSAEQLVLSGLPLAGEPELQQEFLQDIRDLLLLNDLQRRSAPLVAVLCALGLIELGALPPLYSSKKILVRRGSYRPRLRLERVSQLLADPGDYLEHLYIPAQGDFDDEAARRFIHRLVRQLQPLAALGGARLQSHGSDLPAALLPPLSVLLGRELSPEEEEAHRRYFRSATLLWTLPEPPISFGLRAKALPTAVPGASGIVGPALELSLMGGVEFPVNRAPWSGSLSLAAEGGALGISRDEVRASVGTPSLSAGLDLLLSGPWVAGADRGPRLGLENVGMQLFAKIGERKPDAGFGLSLHGLSLSLGGAEADSFVGSVVPSAEFRLDADLAWSIQGGLIFGFDSGLHAHIPLNLKLPLIELPYVDLAVEADELGLRASARTLVLGKLGPLSLTVEGLGVQAALVWQPLGGQVELLPPTGIGFSLLTPVISGGGFLNITRLSDGSNKYEGAAGFEILDGALALSAFGIVIAGPKRFSMLVSITASFQPIQLGFGFTLNGVGGLIGINRTMDPIALGEGARNGQLDAVLFPQNAAEEAPQILQNLDTFFPELENSYVVGAMVSIGYQSFIVANLGVIVSFPSPLRIALLGQLHALLPAEKGIVVLHLDVAGILDITGKRFSLDAGLYNSSIAGFALSGQMAMRLNYGDRPEFLLSLGGFHPAFAPPSGFPKLERLSLAMDFGEEVELCCSSYFAITSNTLQFGARADLHIGVGGFEIDGSTHFDALICFRPFHMTVGLGISVSVSALGLDLIAGSLEVELSGPAPRWKVAGTAYWSVAGVEDHKDFSLEFGKIIEEEEREQVDVRSLIRAAIRLPDALSCSAGTLQLRALTEEEEEEEWAALDSSLQLRQRVAPLELPLERFGTGLPLETGPFRLRVATGATVLPLSPLEGNFALGQFLDLSLAEQLSAPSFDTLVAGVETGPLLSVPIANNKASVRPEDQFEVLAVPASLSVPAALKEAVVGTASSYVSRLRGAQRRELGNFAGPALELLTAPTYALATGDGLSPADTTLQSYASARKSAGENRIIPSHLLRKAS